MNIKDIFNPANKRTFLIGELSANHAGSIDIAKETIKAAKECGLDAIKLQTYTGSTITLNSEESDFLIPTTSPWASHRTLFRLYEEAHTPWEWHSELFEFARRVGICIFSTPFDESAVELLEGLGAPAYKIASPEITHIPLIERVAKTRKPVIVSTGVAEVEDLDLAVKTLRDNGCEEIAILRCTTEYPAPIEDSNLASLQEIKKRYGVAVGLSDHTIGSVAGIVSVALGGTLIEKHFILNHEIKSADQFFSADRTEMARFVAQIREAEKTLGTGRIEVPLSARKNMIARRSLYVSEPVKKGERFTAQNIRCVRPGHGLHPRFFKELLGQVAYRDFKPGERLTAEALKKQE